MTNPNRSTIRNEALEWRTRLYSGEASAEDQAAFKAWLSADPLHAEAFRDVETVWRMLTFSEPAADALSQAKASPPTPADASAPGRSPRRLALFAAAAALFVIPSLAVFLTYAPAEVHETGVGEIRDLTLADGSTITLGGDSRITARLSRLRRHVALDAGEAVFDIASVPSRPFIVNADLARVRVTGTQFEVSRRRDAVDIRVAEGAVTVSAAGKTASITAGSRVQARTQHGLSAVKALRAEAFAAWRDRHFTFHQAPLSDVVETLNRYHTTPMRIGEPHLRSQSITASFGLDQIADMLTVLELSYGIRARPLPDGTLVLETL